jgi:hypothetical protein
VACCTDLAEFIQASLRLIDLLYPLLGMSESGSKGVFEWGKPRIELDHAWALVN